MKRGYYVFVVVLSVVAMLFSAIGCAAPAAPSTPTGSTPAASAPASSTPAAQAKPTTGAAGPVPTASAQGETKPIELTLSHHLAATSWFHRDVNQPFADEVYKESNGRLHVTVYPGAALAKVEQAYDACVKGIADIAMFLPMYTPGVFPLADMVGLPFAIPSSAAGTDVVTQLLDKDLLDPKLKEATVTWLGTTSPMGIVLAKKKVTKMQDLKGLKLRIAGGLQNEMGKALGWTSVAIPGAELQTALASGVVEGGIVPIGTARAYNLMEHTKYVVTARLQVNSVGLIMNKDKWNSLPPDLQKVIDTAARHFLEHQATGYDREDTDAVEVFKKAGAEIIDLDPAERARWMAACVPIYDDYLNQMKAKGLPVEKAYAEFKSLLKNKYNVELPR